MLSFYLCPTKQHVYMTEKKTYPIHFAPLQGFTDAAYRNAHHRIFGGVATYYTPFVRLEKGDSFRNREQRDILPSSNEVPHLIPQLIASTPEELRRISELFAEHGHREADINLGCPFPMLVKRHKGSGILPYPDEVKALLETTCEFPEISFSIKLRLGWESPDESLALLPVLNDFPLRQITLHPRLGKQQYKGDTDMEGFEAFYNRCKHPLLYNGDLLHTEDIDRITKRFPNLCGIMIGRGLLANPALAQEYSDGKQLSLAERLEKIKALHNSLLAHYQEHLQGDAQLLCKMKTFWEYLLPDLEKKIRKNILKSTKMETYRAHVREAFKGASL